MVAIDQNSDFDALADGIPVRPHQRIPLHVFSPGAILASLPNFFLSSGSPEFLEAEMAERKREVPVLVAGPHGTVTGNLHEIEPAAQKFRRHKFMWLRKLFPFGKAGNKGGRI